MAKKRKGLSDRQKRMLEFICDFIDENSYSPSLREIGSVAEISSTSVVNYNLDHLQNKGCIDRDRDTARSIRVLEKGLRLIGRDVAKSVNNLLRIPIWGVIKAGNPIPVPEAETPLDYISLAKDLAPRGDNVFALRVSGDSMIDALVNDGDVVVMNKNAEVREGDMVAAWLKDEEETTLKYFYRDGDKVRLQPANPHMEPIYTPLNNIEIQGKVMMVVRTIEA